MRQIEAFIVGKGRFAEELQAILRTNLYVEVGTHAEARVYCVEVSGIRGIRPERIVNAVRDFCIPGFIGIVRVRVTDGALEARPRHAVALCVKNSDTATEVYERAHALLMSTDKWTRKEVPPPTRGVEPIADMCDMRYAHIWPNEFGRPSDCG